MSVVRALVLAGLVGLLAGCGGSGESTAATTAQVVSALRARALALVADVAPEEAARQLLDFGESSYPQYFPGRGATASYPPFVYRHYPSTGVYLGVVVTSGMGYENLGVYVMGGPFGSQPSLVGPLSSFITPTVPDGGSSSNGCYDQALALAEVAGTRTVVVYQSDSLPGGFLTMDFTAVGPATFEGHAAFETLIRQAAGSAPGGLAEAQGVITSRSFDRKTGPAEITQFGTTSSSRDTRAVGPLTITAESSGLTWYDPPWIERGYSVPLGGRVTMSTTSRSTSSVTTTVSGRVPVTSTTSGDAPRLLTVAFLRREPVTVPAGSFRACVFEMTDEMPGMVFTVWVADGKGFPLKSVTTYQGATTTQVTTSIRLNGVPVVD